MNIATAALRTRSESAFALSANRYGASATLTGTGTGSVLGSTHDRAVIAVAPTPAVAARPGTKQDRPPRGIPR